MSRMRQLVAKCAIDLALSSMLVSMPLASVAQEEQGSTPLAAPGPRQPDDCVTEAANYHAVSPWTLRAIIQVESRFNAAAVNRNTNGTTDVGLAQINSIHFKELGRHGIAPRDLLNGCISSYVAAWHLKKQINAYGNTWYAVGAYHSTNKCLNQRYTGLVWNALRSWGVVAGPGARPGPISSCVRDISPLAGSVNTTSTNKPTLLTLD